MGTPGAQKWEDVDWSIATAVADKVIASKTYDEWHSLFVKKDVWHVRINRFEDMWEDEQATQSGIFVQVPGVQHKLLGNPVLFSAVQHTPSAGAPSFGQHSSIVLREHDIT